MLGTPAATDDGAIAVPLELRFSEAVVGEAAALAATDPPSRAATWALQLLASSWPTGGGRSPHPSRSTRASRELLQRRHGGGGRTAAKEGKVFEAGNAAAARAVLAGSFVPPHIAGEG